MPTERDGVGWIPFENFSPVAEVALGIALVPSASYAGFHEDGFERCIADVMSGWPPGLHLLDKDGEGALDRGFYAQLLRTAAHAECLGHVYLL